MAKERFKSKSGFILASVGAAVGLGNALRFPGLCAKYGGGAYLFIYISALIILGVPLLNAELALGRKVGGGAPKCFKTGWASCTNSVLTAFLYAGLAGWILSAAVEIVPLAIKAPALSQTEISGYYFDKILHARTDGAIDGISLPVCLAVVFAWAAMYFCLRGGANSLSKAAKFTVIIPVVLLVFMAGRGLLYQNSKQALAALFLPDFSKLSSPELWLSALGQVFFSLSVVVGIMPAYGAYLPEGTNIFECSLVIAAADFLVSVLASVVMFTTLYGCGLQGEIGQSGIITAFAVYPAAITQLFGGNTALNAAAGVLFYLSLFMMAVQSAVSMLEAFVFPFSESRNINKKRLALIICLFGAATGVIFATTAGAVIVEVADRFVNFYNVLLLGIAECLIFTFNRGTVGLTDEINRFTRKIKMPKRFFGISVKFLSPAVLTALTALEVVRLCRDGLNYPTWILFGFGWGLSLVVVCAAVYCAINRGHKHESYQRAYQ